jgi:hypothetical protein
MDRIRQYISAATDRPEHTIEQADAEVGGAAATFLEQGRTEPIGIYTNDLPAFSGIERALSYMATRAQFSSSKPSTSSRPSKTGTGSPNDPLARRRPMRM